MSAENFSAEEERLLLLNSSIPGCRMIAGNGSGARCATIFPSADTICFFGRAAAASIFSLRVARATKTCPMPRAE